MLFDKQITLKVCSQRVEKAIEALGVDYIDILQIRLNLGPCSKGTPLEETARAMKVWKAGLCIRSMIVLAV